MKKLIVGYFLGIFLIAGCYPKYEDLPRDGRAAAVVAEVEPFGVLVAEMQTPGNCIDGEGSANVIAIWSSQNQNFAETDGSETIDCSKTTLLSPAELYIRLEGARTDDAQISPQVPILRRPPGRGIYSKFGGSSLFVSSDSKTIQIIYGSYGNREGVESEHVYSLTKSGDRIILHSQKLTDRMVQLEMLSGF